MAKDIEELTSKLHEQNKLLLELKAYLEHTLGKPHGDIIESGGSKTINNYYYDSVKRQPLTVHEPGPTLLTARLQTPKAQEILDRLVAEGLLDELWQPVHLSGTQRSLVAKAICDRLDINDVWQVFGQVWNENPITLRSYYNKAMNQKKTYLFLEKLKNILG